jgi:hypothetical protein
VFDLLQSYSTIGDNNYRELVMRLRMALAMSEVAYLKARRRKEM